MRKAMLPALAATTIGLAVAGCGDSGLSSQDRADFVNSCSAKAPASSCNCIYQELTTKFGYNSQDKVKGLLDRLQSGAIPANFLAAIRDCRGK